MREQARVQRLNEGSRKLKELPARQENTCLNTAPPSNHGTSPYRLFRGSDPKWKDNDSKIVRRTSKTGPEHKRVSRRISGIGREHTFQN